MELDDLKEIWKHSSTKDTEWSTTQLHEVLQGKSKSILSRIKRSMQIEITIGCVAFAVLISQIFVLKVGPTWWLMISILVFSSTVAIYFYLKMRLVTTFDFATNNLKNNLTDLITKLETFLKIYKLGNQWGLIFFYLLGLLATYLELGTDRGLNYVSSWQGQLFLILFTVCVISPVFFVDRVLRKLYGKHIDRLKLVLAEFEKSAEE
jgi:hypothetical protein